MKNYKKKSKFDNLILEHAESFCFLVMLFSSLFIVLLFINILSMYFMDLQGFFSYDLSEYILKIALLTTNIISFALSKRYLIKLIL